MDLVNKLFKPKPTKQYEDIVNKAPVLKKVVASNVTTNFNEIAQNILIQKQLYHV
jgi:hypothetical protein